MAQSGNQPNSIFEVTIAGQPLRLKSTLDQEVVNQLVSLVNQKVQDALTRTKSGSLHTATVLAALNLAEELILLKSNALRELNQFEKKAQKVLESLESSTSSPRVGLET